MTHPDRCQYAHLLRLRRARCNVRIRHGLHLQLLRLHVSFALTELGSRKELTFGTATCRFTPDTASAAVNLAKICTTPG